VILMCMSLMTPVVSIFSCASWPCVHLVWRNVYWNLLLQFYLVCPFVIET
jgi:hypothetical protein